jgi:hypothetical protein
VTGGGGFNPRIVLRPRALDETFDLAVAYARLYWRDFGRVILVSAGVGLLIAAAAKVAFGFGWERLWVLTFVLAPLIERATTAYAGNHLFGTRATLRAGLMAVVRRPFLSLASALLIPLPAVPLLADPDSSTAAESSIPLMIAWAVPWAFLLARSHYFTQVALLEGSKLGATRRRALRMVDGRFGRSMFFVVAAAHFRFGAAVSADLAVRFVVGVLLQLGEPMDGLFHAGGSWAALAGYLAAAPLVALARLFDYVDARTRTDGWDIQVRFKAIVADERARSPISKATAAAVVNGERAA